jgi:8-oxo-dGTP pyrophosphatase MutT (NUDIX family)
MPFRLQCPLVPLLHYRRQEKPVLPAYIAASGVGRSVTKSRSSAKLQTMVREISAGGVVIRRREGAWWMAAIEPPGEAERSPTEAKSRAPHKAKPVLALPKGLVDPGEKAAETALREVFEETGVTAELVAKLADIKYVYSRTWSDGQRVFKIVSFYLMLYRSGRINQIAPEMRIEVARALWIPLEEAPRLLAYKGEKQMAKRAQEYVIEHPEFLLVDA